MSDFPSMHARDAAKLPHVSLEELSARVPRESALIQPTTRAKPYDPAKRGRGWGDRVESPERASERVKKSWATRHHKKNLSKAPKL